MENPNTGRYECRCVTGYTGNGYECQVLDCRLHKICDQNADCVDDPFFGGYRCLCRNGFVGEILYNLFMIFPVLNISTSTYF